MEANKQPKVEEIVISMGDGGREFITVPHGAVLSPITVSSTGGGGGIQQWQTVKTTMAGQGQTLQVNQGQPQVRSIMTTSDPNVITVNGAVLSPVAPGQQYQVAGQPNVQTYYTTTGPDGGQTLTAVVPSNAAAAATAPPGAVSGVPVVVGKKSKAGLASQKQTVQLQQPNAGNIIDVKNVTPLPQAVLQQVQSGNWNGTSQPQTVNLISTDQGWSTIKLENPGQAPQTVQVASPGGKTSTINTSGLQFISTGPTGVVQPAGVQQPQFVVAGPGGVGGRKTTAGTIIETFKCEVCNQVFQSMAALQTHVSTIHEAPTGPGAKKGGKKGAGGGVGGQQPALHCEYKYSGGANLNNTVTVLQSPGGQTIQLMPQAAQVQAPAAVAASQAPLTVMTGNSMANNQESSPETVFQGTAGIVSTVGGGGAPQGITQGSNGQTFITAPAQPAIVVGKNGKIRKEKKRNWQCDTCMNRFSRKDHLAKHVSAVHMKVRPFECGTCGQKFSQKHHLRAHMLARHEDDKTAAKAFACAQCHKRFTRNDHLERHIESVHEKRKQFECAVCSHQFARKHHLSKHILAVHAKVKPYGCHLCDQSFLQRHHLGSHIMSVHQPPVHEEEDGSKTFVCAICFHRFKRKDHLKTHVETVHEKARNYACQLCERRFGQKFHLAIHVSAVHEGKKPHACHLCTHKSARKSGLQRHLKTVHNILPVKQQQQQAAQQAAQQQQLMQIKQEVGITQPTQTIQLQGGQHMQVVQLGPNGQITGDPIVVTPQQLASPSGGLPQGAQLVTLSQAGVNPVNSQAMSPQAVTVTVTPSGNVVSSQ